jgi:transcriptional regulator with XRE-family HTH domain
MSGTISTNRPPRLLLGERLRKLRRRAEVCVEDAADVVGIAQATVWRMERGDGRRRFRLRDVEALSRLYGAGNSATDSLVRMARTARQEPWFGRYRQVVPDGFDTYLELESYARRLSCHAPDRLPDLLQTEEYARAVLGAAGGLDDAEVGLLVELRLARQEVLTRDEAARFTFVVGEAGLRRAVWGGAVMARQLRHLVELGARANVSVRVLRAEADTRGECGAEGFEIMEFAKLAGVGTLDAKVFVDDETPGRLVEDAAAVERIRRVWEELVGRALDGDASRELIEEMAVRWERRCGALGGREGRLGGNRAG